MDSGSDSDNGSQFLTSGSSALILAFLAIGLFVGGLLVMLAMRRYVVRGRRRAGTWAPAGAAPWNWEDGIEPLFTITVGPALQRRQGQEYGARPELLDVHAVTAADDDWEDIMPISVAKVAENISPVPELSAQEQTSADGTGAVESPPHASSGYLRPFVIDVHDFLSQVRPSRRRASPSPSRSSPLPPPPALESPMPAPAHAKTPYLRVALAIAMPTQQRCSTGVPQYALGITDVKRSSEPVGDLQRETRDGVAGD